LGKGWVLGSGDVKVEGSRSQLRFENKGGGLKVAAWNVCIFPKGRRVDPERPSRTGGGLQKGGQEGRQPADMSRTLRPLEREKEFSNNNQKTRETQ